MKVPVRDYDKCFEGAELKRIRYLRTLDDRRKFYGWLLGICIFVVVVGAAVLLGQFLEQDAIWVAAFWLGLVGSIFFGLWLPMHIDGRIEREFIEKWDPLFIERTPVSLSQIAAREEINRLIDSYHWYGLSDEQQRATVKAVNRKYGLE